MAYRFDLDETVARGLRRIGREQIGRAEAELTADGGTALKPGAVHETRKTMKRLRALLRLVRPAIGETAFKLENARYRDIARLLAGTRDRVVMLAALDTLAVSAPASLAKDFALARNLVTIGAPADNSDDREAIARAAGHFDKAKTGFRDLRLKHKGYDALAPGLKKTYRRGRRHFASAYATEATDEVFHDWRKSVQQHWRHMQLVSKAWSGECEARAVAARELAQVLGLENDLAMLANYLRSRPDGHSLTGLLALIDERKAESRALAQPLGARLYAERPRALVVRFAANWANAKRSKSGIEPAPSVACKRQPGKPQPTSRRAKLAAIRSVRAR